MSFAKQVWTTLASEDVSEFIEEKMKLSYLSWAGAYMILMKNYPESNYTFNEPKTYPDGSVEVECIVAVKEGEKTLVRSMWLPVMDHRNASVINPSSRQISDAKMRCLVKCLAMFGLGINVYKSGEGMPDETVTKAKMEADYAALVEQNRASIDAVIDGIANDDLSAAAEAFFEMDRDTQGALWKAPSKGGVFSTKEREVIKSKEFREAHYGKPQ